MTLPANAEVVGETTGMRLRIQKKLGEGGQGIVYLATASGKQFALKVYHADLATADQRAILRELIRQGPPERARSKFVWPIDIVPCPAGFGYLMPLFDSAKFTELGQVMARRKDAPTYETLCEITFQVAASYQALHAKGYCYRDINTGNVVFDPQTGEVLICDNDNVGIDKHSKAAIQGTLEFMPPELILGQTSPSTATDKHMLAVFLFQLWMWHHPLHGQQEYSIRSWDLIAKRKIYGTEPVFVFHPGDTRNRLPAEYATAATRWADLPRSLQELFLRAFVEGLRDPEKRVTDGEWKSLAQRLKDATLICGSCRAGVLWDVGRSVPACWHCHTRLTLPPVASFPASPQQFVTLIPGRKLLQRHVEPHNASDPRLEAVIGEVVQNPQVPGQWGLRNLSPHAWIAVLPDGNRKEVPPQKALPLQLGTTIQVPGASFLISSAG